jgi:hypothetical protein
MKSRLFRIALPTGGALALFLAGISNCPTASPQTIGPITQTFTSAGSPPVRACGLKGQNSATFQATGAGPINAQVSNDGVSWTPATISTLTGAIQAQPFTPTSGTIYQVTPLNADCVQIAPDSTWTTQNVTISFKASGAIAAIPTPGGASTTPAPCATAASPAPAGICAHSIAGVGGSAVPYASIGCNQGIPIAIAMPSATTTELMAGTANEQIFLCGFQVQLGSNGVTFKLAYSATNCLATIALTPAQSGSTAITALTTYASLIVPAGDALCATTTGASGSAMGYAPWTQF